MRLFDVILPTTGFFWWSEKIKEYCSYLTEHGFLELEMFNSWECIEIHWITYLGRVQPVQNENHKSSYFDDYKQILPLYKVIEFGMGT